jgi:outer membrane protein OmpA-like peptidoglycan-associated protein
MLRPITPALLITALVLTAQERNPTQQMPAPVTAQASAQVPIFRVEVVERTTSAINYLHRGGSTKLDFQGTPLMPSSKGEVKVESERGVIRVSAKFEHMAPPSSFGPEYLTYVLWAISPDGRPVNLGELTLSDYGKGSDSSIDTTSDIQTFGLIVTAEPYYGVTQPSDVVVMENVVRPDTQGVREAINARYELLPRGMYTAQGKASGFVPVRVDKKNPFELYEAENAVQLARVAGADQYAAADSFQKALAALDQAHKYQAQKPGQKPVITMAREAVVRAEDARVVAIRREHDDLEARRLTAEKEKAEAARVRAQEESQQRARAEAERTAAETAKREALAAADTANRERVAAQTAKLEADQARYSAEQARQAALVQQQQLAADADKARLAAAESERQRQDAEQARQAALVQQQQSAAEAEKARGAAAESERQRQDAEQSRQAALVQQQQLAADADKARLAAVESERQRKDAEQARQVALVQQQQLAADADEARLAAVESERQRKDAEQARQVALVQQQQLAAEAEKARGAAAESERQRKDVEQQQAQLRQQLFAQFNQILQTRDTARGLIVNMSDVLFDSGQYSLKPGAREKLAKVSGIILAHPGLKIEVEGHTDSVGGDDYNMKLSENRANVVRSYLVDQGASSDSVTAKGFGKTVPVADNATAAGRQMNRRVELVVSGEILGASVTGVRTSTFTSR